MFSHNGKISEKQMQRMLILPVFASGIFVIPHLAACFFRESIIWGLLIFFVFACVYMGCIWGIAKWRENGKKAIGKPQTICDKILLPVQVVRLIIRQAFYVVLSIAILAEAQVPFMQEESQGKFGNLLAVLPLLFVAVYAANVVKKEKNETGIEKQGRIHEMIFWEMFIPFIIVLAFGLREVDYEVFLPHMDMGWGNLVLCGYLLLVFLLPVENYLYLRPLTCQEKRSKKNSAGRAYAVVLCTIFAALLITLIIIGIYGVNGAAQEKMVTISIMRYIRLPFGVLERFDALMVWFFMAGCFVLLGGTLYFAGHRLAKLFPEIKRIWLLVGIMIVVLLLVAWLPAYEKTLQMFLWYGAVVDVPLSLLLPLIEREV